MVKGCLFCTSQHDPSHAHVLQLLDALLALPLIFTRAELIVECLLQYVVQCRVTLDVEKKPFVSRGEEGQKGKRGLEEEFV